MGNSVDIAYLGLKREAFQSCPSYVWVTLEVRDVHDEFGVVRAFEVKRRPTSRTWDRASVSLAHQLNVASGGANEAAIWYDPGVMTKLQAAQAVKAVVHEALQTELASLESRRSVVASLALA